MPRGDQRNIVEADTPYGKRMLWGQIAVPLALACFAAIALYMMRRTPHA